MCHSALHALIDEGVTTPLGVFGHSQGGWVVIEAAGRGAPAAFVISNSGPGVTPAVQDRFALGNVARRAGSAPDEVEQQLHGYDVVGRACCVRVPVSPRHANVLVALGLDELNRDPINLFAGNEREWVLAGLILDHDPVPAMRGDQRSRCSLCSVPTTRSCRSARVWPRFAPMSILGC